MDPLLLVVYVLLQRVVDNADDDNEDVSSFKGDNNCDGAAAAAAVYVDATFLKSNMPLMMMMKEYFANYCPRLFAIDGNDCDGCATFLPTSITTISSFSVFDAIVIALRVRVRVRVIVSVLLLPPPLLILLILLHFHAIRIGNTKRCRQTCPVARIQYLISNY